VKKYIILTQVFIFLSGCSIYKSQEGYDHSFSLDEALKNGPSPDDISYLGYLRFLRGQANNKTDIEILDQKIAAIETQKQKEYEDTLKLSEKQAAEQKQIELQAKFESKRKELIKEGGGTLKNKSSQQVNQLVDGWGNTDLGDSSANEWLYLPNDYFSAEKFYQVFGKPIRTQLLNLDFIKYYNLIYECKDGTVIISVLADSFDNGIVRIKELNIL
jgi:hypothetical protein